MANKLSLPHWRLSPRLLLTFTQTIVLVFLVSGGQSFSPAYAQSTDEEQYQTRLKKLQENITDLKKEISNVKNNRAELQDQLQVTETNISDLLKQIEQIKEELASQKKQLSQLRNEQAEMTQAKQNQEQHVAQQVNAAYRLGRQNHLKLLLNQQDPSKVTRMLRYYDYFLEARTNKIEGYVKTLARANTLEEEITLKNKTLNQTQEDLLQRHQMLEWQQKQRHKTIARLSRTLRTKDAELKAKSLDMQRLEQLLEEVTSALADVDLGSSGTPFVGNKGKMQWPVKGVMKAKFGSRRAIGKLKWEGVVIGAPTGSNVRAIHHGRVVFSDYLRGHGLLLIMDHGGGYMSLYAHNQTLLKDTGEWVKGGETIAQVGQSGGQSEAGLYFEIRRQGKPTNPSHWCRG